MLQILDKIIDGLKYYRTKLSKIKSTFSIINWKLTGTLIVVPFIGEFLDSYISKARLFDDSGDYFQIGIESLFLGLTGIYISHRNFQQRKLEEELIKSNQILESITHSIDEGILLLDKDYSIVWANESFLKSRGLNPEKVIGNLCYKITHDKENPCDSKDDECPIKGLLKINKPVTVTHTHFNREGNKNFVEVTVYPVRDKSGEIKQYIHMTKNITKEKQLEEERIKASRLEGIYDLVVAVNHEMNQPLAVLVGYSDILLRKAEKDSETSHIAASIYNATWRLADLVKKVGQLKEKKIDEIKIIPYSGREKMIDLNAVKVEEPNDYTI